VKADLSGGLSSRPPAKRIAADVAAVTRVGAQVLEVGCGPATWRFGWPATTTWR
jgi:hypothetical protein